MRTLLICWLALVLAACGGSSSSGSADSSNTPSDGNTDNGGDPGTGDNGGTDNGGDNGGTDNGGDTGGGDPATPQQPDCNWASPAEVTAAETFGNTASASTYDLSSYSERTDLDSDLTGTWVAVHRLTSVTDDGSNHRTRTVWQTFTFVIRDNAGTLQVADCANGSSFVDLSMTGEDVTLPLFRTNTFSRAQEAPSFTLSSSTHMQGEILADYSYNNGRSQVSLSAQNTAAIKVSGNTAALGQHSVDLAYDGVNVSNSNQDIWCISQERTLSASQDCANPIQPSLLTLALSTASSSGLASLRYSQQQQADGSEAIGTVLSHISNQAYAIKQSGVPSAFSITTSTGEVSTNIAFDDAKSADLSGSPKAATGSYVVTSVIP